MEERDLARHVAQMVQVCESHLEKGLKYRARAMEYYNGEMRDMIADDGRSAITSRDVRASIKKLMPSVMRSILSNDRVVSFSPVGQEDEESAEQATLYINTVTIPESNAEKAIHDAIFDAMLLKTGILKWRAYRENEVTVTEFTNQTEDAVLGLLDDEANGVLDYEETEETDPGVLELNPDAKRYSFRLRRSKPRVDVRLECVPRGSFLIHPDADTIEEASVVGERQTVTRSDLVEMGYDRKLVDDIIAEHRAFDDDDYIYDDVETRVDRNQTDLNDLGKAMDLVVIYEVYVRIDDDDDGVAELYRIVYANGTKGSEGHVILGKEQVSEAPYADVVVERDPHQFEGHSIFEDMEDVQRVKTALTRSTLDNLYWQNNPQPTVDFSRVENPEAIMEPKFGQPILLKPGTDASKAVNWNTIPFIAKESFSMLNYMDEVAKDRTGITDASGGVDPQGFVNMSATAAQMISDAGVAQAEMMVRNIARGGLRKAFRGLLKLVIAHADQPRTVRMQNEWVEFNPAVWNADMDATVNVGLGAGSRERDMQVLQVVLGLQREILGSLGADNPLVKPDQLYNTLEKIAETSGLPSADPFFTKPDPEEVQARLDAAKNQPNPDMQKMQMQAQLEMQKMQTQAQIEQQKLEIQMQVEARKSEAAQAKEAAQMAADLQVKQAEAEKNAQAIMQKAQVEAEKFALQLQIEREKIASAERIANAKLAVDARSAVLKAAGEDAAEAAVELDSQADAMDPESESVDG